MKAEKTILNIGAGVLALFAFISIAYDFHLLHIAESVARENQVIRHMWQTGLIMIVSAVVFIVTRRKA